MASYARLYESLGPLYKGSAAAQGSANQQTSGGLKSIGEDPPKQPGGVDRKFEPVVSGRSHPAPGSRGGSLNKPPDSGSDNDEPGDKNSSVGSYRPRPLGARASLRASGDSEGAGRRPGSPLPAASSLSPRPPSLHVNHVSTGGDGDDGHRLNRRTAAGDRQTVKENSAKSYDTMDNMRLGGSHGKTGKVGGDDQSSSEVSDAARYRPAARSSLASRRRQDAGDKGDPDLSPPRAGIRSTLRDDGLPQRRRRELALDSGDDSPPRRSSNRGEGSYRRRKDTDDATLGDDLPLRRRKATGDNLAIDRTSPRATLRSTLRDDSPLRSTSREESIGRRRYLKDRDDVPLGRRMDDLNESSDSSPLQSEVLPRRRRRLDLNAKSDRVSSPPLRSTSRDEFPPRRRTDPDDSTSKRLSPRPGARDSLHSRGKVPDDSSYSPPLKSEDVPLRRPRNLTGRDESPPLRPAARRDLLADREPSPPRVGSKHGDNLSPRRQRDAPYKQTSELVADEPRSISGTSQLLKGTGEKSDARRSASTSRDKEQPKSGVLKRTGSSDKSLTGGRGGLERKATYIDKSSSDSESSHGKKGSNYGADRPPIRPKLGENSGKSLSTPAKPSVRKSPHDESSLKRGKELEDSRADLSSRRSGTSLSAGSRDDLSLRRKNDPDEKSEKEKRLTAPKTTLKLPEGRRKDLSDKGVNYLSPRAATRDDRLSPRRSGIPDDKKATTPRTAAKTASRDDLSLGRQKEPGRIPGGPDDRAENKLTSPRFGLKARDAHKHTGLGADQVVSRHSTGFDFTKSDQRRQLMKLKRPLPANLSGTRYELVKQAAKNIDFAQSASDDFKTPFLIWTDSFISTERLTQLKPFQRVNHFPGMAEISRKDLLAKNLGKLAKLQPGEYNFAPPTWCLPGELGQFQQYAKELQKAEKKQKSFISKPVDGASGRGIKIYKTAEDVPQSIEGECVLQEYVSNPFLIENVKFDLRLYVLVTSCDPLRVYFFNDGFIRMSSEPYVHPLKCTLEEGMAFIHLTNSSVNKQNQPDDATGSRRRGTIKSGSLGGNRRSLKFLNEYLQKANYDVALVWRNIVDLMLKTVFAAYPHLLRSYRQCRPADGPASGSVCFELLGFDILLDANLKPWLMEVNRSPSFDFDVTAERDTKLQLLEETLMLLSVSPSDRKRASAASARPGASSAKGQKELADLMVLLARLKRQDRLAESDARVCQKFRRIFPTDNAARQEKLVTLLVGAFPALLEAGAGPLQRELESFYANKLPTDEVAKQLAQRSSKTVQQLAAETQPASGDSSSGDEEEGEQFRRGRGRLGIRDGARRSTKSKEAEAEAAARKKQKRKQRLQLKQQQLLHATADSFVVHEQLASEALKYLNQLSIRFPGKSGRQAERMLRDLQDNWKARKADVGAYWRLNLDADKRRKVLDIARQNVRVTLDKAFRGAEASVEMSATAVSARASAGGASAVGGTARLFRLFEKLYNRLLWCKGQGLWETFGGRSAAWEKILCQSRETPTMAEMNCCRRVVQLCQDCLLIVFLYSGADHQQVQQPQQPQQLPLHPQPMVVS